MLRTIPIALVCSLFLVAPSRGQDVFVPRQLKAIPVAQSEEEPAPEVQSPKEPPAKEPVAARKKQSVQAEPVKLPSVKERTSSPRSEKKQPVKAVPVKAPAVKEPLADPLTEKVRSAKAGQAKELPVSPPAEKIQSAKAGAGKGPAVKEPPANSGAERVQTAKTEPMKGPSVKKLEVKSAKEKVQSAKAESGESPAAKESLPKPEKVQSAKLEPAKFPAVKEPPLKPETERIESAKAAPASMPSTQGPTINVQLLNGPLETASTRLADGFDFPVGKPDAEDYYKARGFRSGGHVGEDWDGIRGGDTDFKDPIYCIGDGIVVFARDVHRGWGNVVIIRHGYREDGTIRYIDSLYGHLNSILVHRGQKVTRGQQVGTMGTAHGQYDAHLHFEIRKNIEIGMSRSKFQKNLNNYHDPSEFIASHRRLSGGGANFRVAMNTFTHDSAFRFDDAPNFSARKRGTAESSAALKRAISSTSR